MGKGLPAWYLLWLVSALGTLIWGGRYSRLGLERARQGWRLGTEFWAGQEPGPFVFPFWPVRSRVQGSTVNHYSCIGNWPQPWPLATCPQPRSLRLLGGCATCRGWQGVRWRSREVWVRRRAVAPPWLRIGPGVARRGSRDHRRVGGGRRLRSGSAAAHWSRSWTDRPTPGWRGRCVLPVGAPPSPLRIGPGQDPSVALVSGKERKWRRNRARQKSRLFSSGFAEFRPTRCASGRRVGSGASGEGFSCLPWGVREGEGRTWAVYLACLRPASTRGP